MPLSGVQLAAAALEAVTLAQQMFGYYSWKAHVETSIGPGLRPLYVVLVQMAVVEAQLMAYRRFNEFFRPVNPRYPDDLKCSEFGSPPTGGFLTDAEIQDIHKRVGHPTTRRVLQGAVDHEIYKTSHRALTHAIPFFVHLSQGALGKTHPEVAEISDTVAIWRTIWEEWSSMVSLHERLQLKA